MCRLICLIVLLGVLCAHAADVDQEKTTQQERIAIAKAALDWLIFDDWGKLKPGGSSGVGEIRMLLPFRRAMQSSKEAAFQVKIREGSNQVELPFAYDRVTRSLVAQEQELPHGTSRVFHIKILAVHSPDIWTVEISRYNRDQIIEIKREDQNYFVDKVKSVWLYD